MDKVYYYLRITYQCIEKKISGIDYQKLLPDISSPANIWNESDDDCNEEESLSNYYTEYSENICFVVSNLWNQREGGTCVSHTCVGTHVTNTHV